MQAVIATTYSEYILTMNIKSNGNNFMAFCSVLVQKYYIYLKAIFLFFHEIGAGEASRLHGKLNVNNLFEIISLSPCKTITMDILSWFKIFITREIPCNTLIKLLH